MPLPFAQKTLAQVRQQIGFLMLGRGKFQTGTASAGAAGSITLAFAQRYPTDYFIGRQIYIYSGTGAGQTRFCTASVISTGVLSVSPNWTVTPDNTSKVEVWSEDLIPDEVNAAINRAIDAVAQDYPVYTETSGSGLDATTRLFIDLPNTFTHFCGVRYVPAGSTSQPIYYVHQWAEWANPNATPNYRLVGARVYLSELIPSDAVSYTVMGYRLPQQLSADTDQAELPADYLVYRAAADLEASEAGGPILDPEQHAGRAGNWFRQAAAALVRIQGRWQPNTELVLV